MLGDAFRVCCKDHSNVSIMAVIEARFGYCCLPKCSHFFLTNWSPFMPLWFSQLEGVLAAMASPNENILGYDGFPN